MATVLPEPLNVSPFIRGCRWMALIAGIGYGSFHYNRLSKKEARLRESRLQHQKQVAERKAAEKISLQRAEMLALAKETNTPIPPDFDKQYPIKAVGAE
ncbi:9.8 kDa basic protein-like [Tropilaelaps mercedesae]|uniref:ATP synthase F(0) complex subunit e, mitochondrial n=1 Tax=Tropilaelaps mercedesae TaxID=418985 RepID=A0A1V9X5H0_9ACAR|nr:9.8 kDa basic protein-like [Tropilaelaps mercedesae]